MYRYGEGVAQDFKQAVFWSRKAADQGVAIAQTMLGTMYKRGHLVGQDYTQAVFWYRKARRAQGRPGDRPIAPTVIGCVVTGLIYTPRPRLRR